MRSRILRLEWFLEGMYFVSDTTTTKLKHAFRGSRSLLKPTVQKEGPIVKSEPADE
jgi:hypothetical protein